MSNRKRSNASRFFISTAKLLPVLLLLSGQSIAEDRKPTDESSVQENSSSRGSASRSTSDIDSLKYVPTETVSADKMVSFPSDI